MESFAGGHVLIESDWNLKYTHRGRFFPPPWRINRIRLEFKEYITAAWEAMKNGINRIRLEFKVRNIAISVAILAGINRIRLEFKVG